jgi:hypothetical protein
MSAKRRLSICVCAVFGLRAEYSTLFKYVYKIVSEICSKNGSKICAILFSRLKIHFETASPMLTLFRLNLA